MIENAELVRLEEKAFLKVWKEALLFRAYWSDAEQKYKLEVTGKDIEKWFISIGNIQWTLDNLELNAFTISNTSLSVKNENSEWKPDQPQGLWNNYFPFKSKIQIKAGYISETGDKILLYVYTGLVEKIIENTEAKTAKLELIGLRKILKEANAEDLHISKDNEVIGTGDDSETEFETSENGVGKILQVYVDGALQEEGTDYTVSNLNVHNEPAKVKFDVAPAAGKEIKANYYIWYQDTSMKWLVEELLKIAEIENYNVEEVVLGGVTASWKQETNADWNSGTLLNLNVDGDTIKIGTDYGIGGLQTVSTGKVNQTLNESHSTLYLRKIVCFLKANVVYPPQLIEIDLIFSADIGGVIYQKIETKSFPNTDFFVSMPISTLTTKKYLSDISFQLSVNFPYLPYFQTLFANDNPYPDGGWVGFTGWDIRFSFSEVHSFMSQTYEVTEAARGRWAKLLAQTNNSEGIEFYTRSSDTNDGWGNVEDIDLNWDKVTAEGIIQSEIKRYFRIGIVMFDPVKERKFNVGNPPNIKTWDELREADARYILPEVYSFEVLFNFGLHLPYANFSGMSVEEGIEVIARYSDYEHGFSGLGTFFFRSKDIKETADFVVDEDVNLISVRKKNLDTRNVFNYIRVPYGQFEKVISSETENEPMPSSIKKYNKRIKTIDLKGQLNDKLGGLAGDIARRYYGFYDSLGNLIRLRYPKAREKILIECQFLPQIELGDIILLKYMGGLDLGDGTWGNGKFWLDEFWNKTAGEYWFFYGNLKVIGITLDLENWKSVLELKEW